MICYKNLLIATHKESFIGYVVLSNSGIIKSVNKGKCNIKDALDYSGHILMPSFIDSHTHGGYDFSFNDLKEKNIQDKLNKYLAEIKKEGVGHVFATTVTASYSDIKKIASYFTEKYPKEFLAWYLEGPYISKEKNGAHDENLIKNLSTKEAQFFSEVSKFIPVYLALAPEYSQNKKMLNQYHDQINFALGHSNDNNFDSKYLKDNKYKRVIHFLNAMSGFHQRNKSLVNSVLEDTNRNYLIEIISDLTHVRSQTLNFLYQSFDDSNIVLVSDSLPNKGSKNGIYKLNNLEVEKKDYLFYLKDSSTLAGSGMPYNLILKNFYKATKCSFSELVKFSSYNVAKSLKSKTLGRIKINTKANFVLIDKDFNVKLHYFDGEKAKLD
ncbi:amidohydrolase family protein [Mycoplasmopsis synoviae]|uniref:N-acetylglucosamine-6-phosphate deacetylase n=2 Tax=Mycoplasmopsis synoviae TaxID=2109 RepID=C0KZ85_MYCSY|nr:amidohydrolase family protein [Mycoplasmopsis synoviae]ACN42900.1 N-acetylglucosamine-6-phosphate deacetylase [Mycoplasmopsis synoviae]UZW63969.1 amidohydrolase family protein [Mycoplasmopsis synoviae]